MACATPLCKDRYIQSSGRSESRQWTGERRDRSQGAVHLAFVRPCVGAGGSGRRQSNSVEPQNVEVSPSRMPGGHANSAELVGVMYSFNASLRDNAFCIGMNWVTGSRTN